jgi:hypothetical protein
MSRGQLKIAKPVSSSWMPYAPQGVKGLDDDTMITRRGNALHERFNVPLLNYKNTKWFYDKRNG